MNQLRDWDGKCQRCYNPSNVHIMSMFDVALVCMTCHEAERKHPQYTRACEAEEHARKTGVNNFKGIGYPREIANDPVDW